MDEREREREREENRETRSLKAGECEMVTSERLVRRKESGVGRAPERHRHSRVGREWRGCEQSDARKKHRVRSGEKGSRRAEHIDQGDVECGGEKKETEIPKRRGEKEGGEK